MERSAIRDGLTARIKTPDFASLHPGYEPNDFFNSVGYLNACNPPRAA
jgi:hypothetical protein